MIFDIQSGCSLKDDSRARLEVNDAVLLIFLDESESRGFDKIGERTIVLFGHRAESLVDGVRQTQGNGF